MRTTLRGEHQVPAEAEPTERYYTTARSAGYGNNTAKMCAEHEAMHSYLLAKLGSELSPTLLHVAQVGEAPREERYAEEAFVLAAQEYINAAPNSGFAKQFRAWLWGE